MRLLYWPCLFTLCFILFWGSACTKSKPDLKHKILNQVSQPLATFDPHMNTGLEAIIQLSKSYEALMETHPFDGPYEVLPNIAEAMPAMSSDGLTYTFKLRAGIKYHPCACYAKDRQVTAHDFVTTFKRIADPHLISPHYGYWVKKIVGLDTWYEKNKGLAKTNYDEPLTGVRAVDDLTLQIQIKFPDRYFVNDITGPVTAPIPMEALKHFNNDLSNNLVGTGPFILQSYVAKSRIEYIKNPEFRHKVFPSIKSPEYQAYAKDYEGKPVPFLDKIVVHIMNENQTQWLNFLKANVDYLEIPKDNFADSTISGQKLSPDLEKKGVKLGTTASTSNVYYLGFNNKHPIFSKPEVRKAIAAAFDQTKYNELFFNNQADLAHTVLPPHIPGNEPPLQSEYIGSQVDKAKALLVKAGYPEGKGLPEVVLTLRNSTLSRQIGDFFVNEMGKIGLKARADLVEWGSLIAQVQKGNYHIFYLAWFVGLPTGTQFFDLLYGPHWPDSYNRMGYQNKKFDALYDKARLSRDLDEQNKIYAQMNQIALEDMPIFPLIHVKDFFVHQGWLKNYVPSEVAGGMEQYYDIDLNLKQQLLQQF